MRLLIEQLERRVAELGRWLELEQTPPVSVRVVGRGPRALPIDDEDDDASAPSLDAAAGWREPLNTTVWLRFQCTRPEAWPAEDTALIARRFGTYPMEVEQRVGLNLQRMQGMLYVDGRPYHGLDQYHRLVFLPPGPSYHFAARVWTGTADFEWQPAPVFRLARVDVDASALYHDLRILHDALRALEPEHTAPVRSRPFRCFCRAEREPAEPHAEQVPRQRLAVRVERQRGGDAAGETVAHDHDHRAEPRAGNAAHLLGWHTAQVFPDSGRADAGDQACKVPAIVGHQDEQPGVALVAEATVGLVTQSDQPIVGCASHTSSSTFGSTCSRGTSVESSATLSRTNVSTPPPPAGPLV
jgi:hypothetical protein